MDSKLWERVEETFHAAQALRREDRNLFLERHCAGNSVLLSEVKTLLNSFESDSDIFDEPVFELGLSAINEKLQKNLTGSTIGFYRIEEKLGAGGMGEVYKAVDTRLNRRVALKFLTDSLENDQAAKRQLVREAQAVAMLEHPNICAVHGIEQFDDVQFIVMQYVEGETLAETIGRSDIDLTRFRSIARQITSAVAFAHSHGVIHRDLKPGNIMVTTDGTIKVLDFGLAKIMPQTHILGGGAADEVSRFSQNGAIIGTVSYMSPEQLRGEKLDYRSDVFSVGVILYEILSGRNPFKRESQAETIAAVLTGEPPQLELPNGFPKAFARIAEKSLAKIRENRFQSVAEILVELDNADSGAMHREKRSVRRPFLAAAALAVTVLVAALLVTFFLTSSSPPRSIAVLPISLDSSQAGKEYLADGLTQSLIDKLSHLSDLKVKSEFLISRYKEGVVDPRVAGRDLNVDAVFSARLVDRDGAPTLAISLIRVSDGFVMDVDEIGVDETNLIDLQEELAARIVRRVASNLSDEDLKKLARKDTQIPEAKLLYMRGRHLFERQRGQDLKNAIQLFTQAKELDPVYTKAWTGLADAYALIGVPGHEGSIRPDEAFRHAKYAVVRAMDIDDTLAEPHVSLATIKLKYDWEWDEAEAEFREAIRLDPESVQAHLGLSSLLLVKRRFAESAAEAKLAKLYSPFAPVPDLYLVRAHLLERNWSEVEKVLNEALTQFPDHNRLMYMKGLLYFHTKRFPEAQQVFEKIYDEDKLYGTAPLALTYRQMGRRSDVLKILQELEGISKENYVPEQEWAWVYLALGDRDAVFRHLTKSCQERFGSFPASLLDPGMDELRADPRFASLEKCANLPG